MRPFRTLAALALASTAASQAPVQETSGGFVVTLGTDTVQLERFTRRGNTLVGVVVTRVPVTRVMSYSMTLAPNGRPQRYEMRTSAADGTPIRTTGTAGSFAYTADSVIRGTLRNGEPATQRIAAPNAPVPAPPLPYLGVSLVMYEFAYVQARALANGATESAWFLLTMLPSQLQPQRQRVWLIGSDSAEADYFGVARSGYKFDAQGRLLRTDWTGTTYKYRGVRVASADVEGMARRWGAVDAQSASFGALSPRDTSRATVGAAQLLVDYSRPSARGRTIWGALVPWDTIWRLGADVATHFTTSADITIGQAHVPAGTYTLWMHPSSSGETTLVVNARIAIFGTAYSATSDFARIPLTRAPARERTERLTIGVRDGRFEIAWDDAVWSAPIDVATASRSSLAAAERALTEVSAARGVRAALGARLSSSGAVLYPGAPVVHGNAAVAQLLAAQPVLDSIIVRWHVLSAMMSRDSTFAMTYGLTYTTPCATAAAPPRIASYASVWRWITGTGWRLEATLLNAPPVASAIPPAFTRTLEPLSATGPAATFIEADLAFARLATTSDPASAFRTYAADDAAVFTAANELRRGKDEIGRLFVGAPPVDWAWHPVVAGAAADGSLGFTIGESTRRPRGDTAATPQLSKYLSVWRREPDGTVRYVFDGGNPRN